MAQLYKRFTDAQVKELLSGYLKKEIPSSSVEEVLGIKRRRFFILLKKYRTNPRAFSIRYPPKKQIAASIEKNILKGLAIQKRLIQDSKVPIRGYNYTYIKDRLECDYAQRVSLPTIINRAKKYGFYLKRPNKSVHDRAVLKGYTGITRMPPGSNGLRKRH